MQKKSCPFFFIRYLRCKLKVRSGVSTGSDKNSLRSGAWHVHQRMGTLQVYASSGHKDGNFIILGLYPIYPIYKENSFERDIFLAPTKHMLPEACDQPFFLCSKYSS